MNDKFPEFHDTTIEDQYKITTNVNGIECNVQILDTAGQEDYITMMDSWISFADGYILVFSVDDEYSFEVIKDRIEKIMVLKFNEFKAKPPIVIVGNKCDLDEDRKVNYDEAYGFSKDLGVEYIECSALNKINVKEAFVKLFSKMITKTKEEKSEISERKKCFCF